MPKIIELEQHVADLIAAGEVVQRPASVVKELMENSIDSGAGIITVEISSGGMTYIRVTDNGCGISRDDVKVAFLRHATSKLKDARGLEAIGTLGFRGEALAAIAAVSRIELLTREPDASEGIRLILEAGDVIDMSPAGCPEGTTIIVRDLFFNTPARLKFMKSDRAEGSAVSSAVLRCALSRPDISFRYIKDGKTECHTPGDSRIDSCVYSLLGRDIEAGFIKAHSSDDNISVEGYTSKPESTRGNRSYQFFFVNGRSIHSLLLQSAIEQAYRNALPPGRFPSCVLYMTIKANEVDVNVHPAKTEIKFVSDKQVFDGVHYAVLGALERDGIAARAAEPSSGKWKVESGKLESVKKSDGFVNMQADEFRNSYISEQIKPYAKSSDSSFKSKLWENDVAVQNKAMFPASEPLSAFNSFRLIGEALNVYIIIEYDNSIWLIDKHAAHERIRFDALKSNDYESMSEALITPVICRIGHENAAALFENADFLDKLGFSIESFGEDAVAVRHIPAEIDIGDTESVLSDFCLLLKHGGAIKPEQFDKVYKIIACKAAIKAGRSSTARELETLAAMVISGEVSHCPHGRPVAFEITKAALDKGFGRA